MRTNQSLDFENGEVREFTVRVTDAFGGSFEKQVQVKVLDAFASIVYTIVPVEIGLNHVVAAGEVVDEGGLGGVEERGFLLSSSPDPTLVSETASVHAVGYGGGAFQTRIDGLLPDKKYYYRAYSANGEGVSYGSSHAFRTQESSIGPVWADAIPSTEAQGWWESPWFGSFHMQDKSGWMHHSELGWAYSMPSAGGGVWFWSDYMDWFWTDAVTYPFIYASESQSWLYFYGRIENRLLFYRYSDNQWLMKGIEGTE